jgi:hypothetical protein
VKALSGADTRGPYSSKSSGEAMEICHHLACTCKPESDGFCSDACAFTSENVVCKCGHAECVGVAPPRGDVRPGRDPLGR